MGWDKDLQRWVDAHLIDAATATRIRQFEESSGSKRWRWPAMLAIGFGALMLCAGILLFVRAHWDQMSPAQRFLLVLGMTAVFHVAAGLLAEKAPAIGMALHVAGTVCLGAGIFLAGQIFNLEEHWPGGIMLWALGAVLAWLVLRQWPQALLAAVLIPWWLGAEWLVATERYSGSGAWNIAEQGFLLLSILYFSVPQRESNRALRLGLLWVGCLALIPHLVGVMVSGESEPWRVMPRSMPAHLVALGYAAAYVPVLALAAAVRKQQAAWIFGSAAWVFVLGFLSHRRTLEHNPWVYLWVALGACLLCWWGVKDNRRLYINYGTAIFALNVIAFYFSSVMDKLGRSMGLILLGVLFLAGGWALNRLRSDLIARAVVGKNQ